jgi:hypothetical protein
MRESSVDTGWSIVCHKKHQKPTPKRIEKSNLYRHIHNKYPDVYWTSSRGRKYESTFVPSYFSKLEAQHKKVKQAEPSIISTVTFVHQFKTRNPNVSYAKATREPFIDARFVATPSVVECTPVENSINSHSGSKTQNNTLNNLIELVSSIEDFRRGCTNDFTTRGFEMFFNDVITPKLRYLGVSYDEILSIANL